MSREGTKSTAPGTAPHGPGVMPLQGRSSPGTTDSSASGATAAQPQTSEHAYDARGIQPRAFLLALMHDRTVPLGHRIEAACKLMQLFGHDCPARAESDCVVKIGGITLQ